ncbi:MAG: hypothetical protein H7249_20135 [Chitinophagaceae bacterium]|nr:hypothetical protein [Oligoflexus sp.]
MKRTYLLAFVPGLFMPACMDTSSLNQSQDSATQSITAQGAASTNLYLADVADAAVTPVAATAAVDASVKDDTKAARLAAMAVKVLDRLDADKSGSLSEEEFLGLAKPLNAKKAAAQTADELAAKQVKLKAEFVQFAGADNSMSQAELEKALAAQGEKVGKFRGEKHKGQHAERVKAVTAEVLAKFDTNKNGVLDDEEKVALRAADKAECQAKHKGGKQSADDKDPDALPVSPSQSGTTVVITPAASIPAASPTPAAVPVAAAALTE